MARLPDLLLAKAGILRDYTTAISGSLGRLVFSLLYFVALANTLSIADFGLFATASAAGVMLSRILAFGYISALYRVATVKPLLLGLFIGGFILMSLYSLPVLAAAAWLTHALFFSNEMTPLAFALVVAAEALLWRPVEAIVIMNNGLNRFGAAAIMVIVGTVLRAAAAVVFAFWATRSLQDWVLFYLAANALSLAVATLLFVPRRRIRFVPRLYWRRLADSIYVAGAEVLFYLQMEMDKLLVLALGGPHLAGIYAIIMRLVDLTAIPVRTFSMMLVQKMMRAPEMLSRFRLKAMIEGGIFAVSTLGLLTLAAMLHVFPNLLGHNVSEAAPLVAFALFVPGLRNLVEYQAELLFARGQTLIRAFNLALLTGLKGLLLAFLLLRPGETQHLVAMLNPMFFVLYLASAALTYSAIRMPARQA